MEKYISMPAKNVMLVPSKKAMLAPSLKASEVNKQVAISPLKPMVNMPNICVIVKKKFMAARQMAVFDVANKHAGMVLKTSYSAR
ncbi:MAG: hypothetical protein WC782_11000 [Methylococcaceae bacterium]